MSDRRIYRFTIHDCGGDQPLNWLKSPIIDSRHRENTLLARQPNQI